MGCSNFRWQVVLRVVALLALGYGLLWGLLEEPWAATPLLCAGLIVLLVVDLIRYVERNNRELAGFLNFVAHQDYSTPVSEPGRGRAFDELHEAYRLLTGEFRRLNLQKEANHQYLEAVIEHVGVALFCFDDDGRISMLNESARRLFGVAHLSNVRSLARVDARLPDVLASLGDGERTLLRVPRADDALQLVFYATRFELLERRYKLVSVQNIRDELEQQEVDAWQKLIRVLTHEIMNSVTPITSLSRLIRETLVDESGSGPALRDLSNEERADLMRGLAAIESRSSGLLDFVRAYRGFATLPAPVFEDVEVAALLDRVRTLLLPDLARHQIRLDIRCEREGLQLRADRGQAEQVLINLLRNAIEVLQDRYGAAITVQADRESHDRIVVQVCDNGPGIDPAQMDNIFVPFFSTKRNGMGVGLSISRHIMKANRGFISARSTPQGSTFTLRFRSAANSIAATIDQG